ncbi:hypothetical protein FB567DRAFT_544949 [Paraphoma chrysanthemicola]|uniref:C2H2-type domain-containing protein n=1 Tax=Paraphoma chrysanthemicola TaxID=798071 RepID=A0A8K0RIT2_9PLEO|nr:hypothetical protein FB567DRAFT_544949 [Paraphoma chrysanthemicola]
MEFRPLDSPAGIVRTSTPKRDNDLRRVREASSEKVLAADLYDEVSDFYFDDLLDTSAPDEWDIALDGTIEPLDPNSNVILSNDAILSPVENMPASPLPTTQWSGDCPCRHARIKLNLPLNCNGLQAKHMSEIRRHIERSHGYFVRQCPTCKEDILNKRIFDRRHGTQNCRRVRKGRRGSAARHEQWNMLYDKVEAIERGRPGLPIPQVASDSVHVEPQPPFQPTLDDQEVRDESSTSTTTLPLNLEGALSQFQLSNATSSEAPHPLPRAMHQDLPITNEARLNHIDTSGLTEIAGVKECASSALIPSARPWHETFQPHLSTHPVCRTAEQDSLSYLEFYTSPLSLLAPATELSEDSSIANPHLRPWGYSGVTSPHDRPAIHRLVSPASEIIHPDARAQASSRPSLWSAAQWSNHDPSEHQMILHNSRAASSSSIARPTQDTKYPTETCLTCGDHFTGKYAKGNFARHCREKHGEIQTLHGKVCRVCEKTYNRADAKRKHEWKKHKLLDSRPAKRRKE